MPLFLRAPGGSRGSVVPQRDSNPCSKTAARFCQRIRQLRRAGQRRPGGDRNPSCDGRRSEEHTSELQSRPHLVCRLLLEKKKKQITNPATEQKTTGALE